jgi:galactan endo-1,6-beta-galactosidase
MPKWLATLSSTAAFICCIGLQLRAHPETSSSSAVETVIIDPTKDLGRWEGWGSSLAWWGRAVGGTANADYYADLIYSTKSVDGYPGLGLNIVRYNVGGGGIGQASENKGPKLQWQMDIHGYWVEPRSQKPTAWDWTVDGNQRSMMRKARERGANVFELFSDSPMWWMNSNHSTAGSDTGGDCLAPENHDRFATYLAAVARRARDDWGIHFGSVEAFNEPSANWWKYPGRQEGCHFDVNTQQVIIQKLRKELDRLGLNDVMVAAADENDADVALKTWNDYDEATRAAAGKVNVHGYYRGTEPYRGSNRPALRAAVGNKRLWQSEYGESDASGYTMAHSIVLDVRGLRPSGWVYWQPVEPDSKVYGWGLLNANYVDTQDQAKPDEYTSLVRVNRKFWVFGQFTRYIRPGCQIISIGNANSVAAYDPTLHKLVFVTVTAGSEQTIKYDLSLFKTAGETVQVIATTTAPDTATPDWKQHLEVAQLDGKEAKSLTMRLYPRCVYTFVVEKVSTKAA